jgi:hypothetical protein
MDKKAAARELLKERTSRKRFKLSEGATTFRVFPNAKGVDKSEYVDYGMHSEVGPKKAYMRCGKKKDGTGSCFLCDTIIPKLEKSGKSIRRQAAERMARRDVFAVQVAYKEEDSTKWLGPALWEMPQSLANGLLGILTRHDVSDPKKGYNLTVTRVGTGMRDTRYGSLERDEERSAAPADLLAKLKPFSEVIRKYEEDQMKAAYYGHEQDEDEDEKEDEKDEEDTEEEDEKPKGKKKSEDEDEEVEEEPEEEEEKPKGKKKVKEEEEEEPEEEEEKPKGKKKAKDEDEDEEVEEDEEFPTLTPDEDDDVEEDEKPKGKKKSKEDEDEEDAEEEDEKPKGKKKAKADEDEEDEDDL